MSDLATRLEMECRGMSADNAAVFLGATLAQVYRAGRMINFQFSKQHNAEQDVISRRRDKVKNMVETGKSPVEIADALGERYPKIYNDLKALKLSAPKHVTVASVQKCKRLVSVREVFTQNLSLADMSKALNCSVDKVVLDLNALGLEHAETKVQRQAREVAREQRANLTERARDLREQKMTFREIGKILGVSATLIQRMLTPTNTK
jgi:DNA-binding CsgD family transcriptional regulator